MKYFCAKSTPSNLTHPHLVKKCNNKEIGKAKTLNSSEFPPLHDYANLSYTTKVFHPLFGGFFVGGCHLNGFYSLVFTIAKKCGLLFAVIVFNLLPNYLS